MKNLIYVFVCIVVFGSVAAASTSVGNGGHVVVCSTAQGETYDLLDLYEAKKLNPAYVADLGNSRGSFGDKAAEIISRIQVYSPQRALHYLENLTTWDPWNSDTLVVDYAIGETRNTGVLPVLEPGCYLEQVAVQRPAPLGQSLKELVISRKQFEKLSGDQQAALIVHELVTEEANQWGPCSSEKLRPFVAYLVSPDLLKSTLKQYLDRQFKAGLRTYEYAEFVFDFYEGFNSTQVRMPEFFPGGRHMKIGHLFGTQPLRVEGGTLMIRNDIVFDENAEVVEVELAADVVPSSEVQFCVKEPIGAGSRVRISNEFGSQVCSPVGSR